MTKGAEPFATLPMYDWPQAAPLWDAFWQETRADLQNGGLSVQPQLHRSTDLQSLWLDEDLLLGQTCGWPFISHLKGKVTPIARLDLGVEGVRAGDYRSVFIAAAGARPISDLATLGAIVRNGNCRIAINAPDSQSGFRVWGECFTEPLLIDESRLVLTGSHKDSIQAVASEQAEFAAIDAVTWRLARAFEPAAQNVSVVAQSGPAPGLPLIMSNALALHAELMIEALSAAIGKMPDNDRWPVKLEGVVRAEANDYAVLLEPPYGNLRVK